MTTTWTPTRTLDGQELPAAARWTIDPGHTEVSFVGRHFMVTKVRGRFTGVSGVVEIGEHLAESSVSVDIDMRTVDSGNPERDEHLRSGDLFDVASHPVATFRSTRVVWSGAAGTVSGDLTIRGTTRSVDLQVSFDGHVSDPWGGERAIFSARTTIDREEFGVSWNLPLATGGVLVSREIQIEINLETISEIP